ncbi:hypothetical protein, partial [Tamlana crocina]|uniref:hypothetical protein n=1 Tax=Tamlana crocina TaxID=393006 RepID=UPI001ADDBFA4
TVEGHTSGGSNPSFSAKKTRNESCGFFAFQKSKKARFRKTDEMQKQHCDSRAWFSLQVPPLGSTQLIPLSPQTLNASHFLGSILFLRKVQAEFENLN